LKSREENVIQRKDNIRERKERGEDLQWLPRSGTETHKEDNFSLTTLQLESFRVLKLAAERRKENLQTVINKDVLGKFKHVLQKELREAHPAVTMNQARLVLMNDTIVLARVK
jgi:hypothetical protein